MKLGFIDAEKVKVEEVQLMEQRLKSLVEAVEKARNSIKILDGWLLTQRGRSATDRVNKHLNQDVIPALQDRFKDIIKEARAVNRQMRPVLGTLRKALDTL